MLFYQKVAAASGDMRKALGVCRSAFHTPKEHFIQCLGYLGYWSETSDVYAASVSRLFRYLTAFILLWKLNNEVDLFSWNIIGDGIIRYLKQVISLKNFRNATEVGGVTGVALAANLFIGFESVSLLLLTDDPAVLFVARFGVWFVTISQPVNAIAFVADGLYNYGVSDFSYVAYSTLFAGAVSSVFLLVAAPKFGLGGIWTGLRVCEQLLDSGGSNG